MQEEVTECENIIVFQICVELFLIYNHHRKQKQLKQLKLLLQKYIFVDFFLLVFSGRDQKCFSS